MELRPSTAELAARLTPRQHAFVQHLLTGMRQIEAYRQAGYADSGGADGAASALRKSRSVATYLARKMEEAHAISENTVAKRLAALAEFADTAQDENARIEANKLLLANIQHFMPAPVTNFVLPERATEADLAARAAGVVDMVIQGQMSAGQGAKILEVIEVATRIAHAASLAEEIRAGVPPRDITDEPQPIRPKWLDPPVKTNGSNGGTNGNGHST